MPTRVFFAGNSILIDTIPTPFVAGSLMAALNGSQVDITRAGSLFVFASPLWSDVADVNGSTFPTPDAAMAYLAGEFAMQSPAENPLRSPIVPIKAVGQTAIPVSPSPVDVNTLAVIVNGIAYFAPTSFGFASTSGILTWIDPLTLIPGDEVVLRYT